MTPKKNKEPAQYDNITFGKKEVALILNCQPLTIYNREQKGTYPPPPPNAANGYRAYTLADVFLLQKLTYSKIILPPIMSLLYDKGYTDTAAVEEVLNREFQKFKAEVDKMESPLPAPIVKSIQE